MMIHNAKEVIVQDHSRILIIYKKLERKVCSKFWCEGMIYCIYGSTVCKEKCFDAVCLQNQMCSKRSKLEEAVCKPEWQLKGYYWMKQCALYCWAHINGGEYGRDQRKRFKHCHQDLIDFLYDASLPLYSTECHISNHQSSPQRKVYSGTRKKVTISIRVVINIFWKI